MPKIEFKTTHLKMKRTIVTHPEFENHDDDDMDLESNEAKADATAVKKDAKKSPERDSRRKSSPDRRRRSSPRKSSPGRRSSPSRKSSPRRSSPRRSTDSRRSSPSRKSSPSRRRSPSKGRSEKRASPDRRRDRRSPERPKPEEKRKVIVPFRTKAQKKRDKRQQRERERNLTPIRLLRSPIPRNRSPDRSKRRSRSPPRRRSPRPRSPVRHRPRSMGKPRTPSPRRSPISSDKRAKIEAELLQEANNSPNSSPLVGLKRSVADSTISDSELQAAAALQKPDEPDYHDFYEKHYDQYYKDYQTPQPNGQDEEEEEEEPVGNSPKRISLDDRIELELGVKKDMPVSQIPVFQFQQANFAPPFFGNQYYQQPYNYGHEKPGWRNHEQPYQMQPNHSDARVLQVKSYFLVC
jgi:hypothetical protein